MGHDVFISHAHKDKSIADAICEKLESARVRCWIAERDISAGEDWTEATRHAIGSSRLMVLVLSENANVAPHIERELAHAYYTKRPIMPVRLSETPPRRDFLFYLGNVPWIDAFSAPTEQRLEELTASINQMVRHGGPPQRNATTAQRSLNGAAPAEFSDSWIGALRASHYQTLGILKRAGIAASLLGIAWLFWFVHEQTIDVPAVSHRTTVYADPRTSDLSTEPIGKKSVTEPTLTYSRFGLWVAPNGNPTPAAPEESQNTLPIPIAKPLGTSSSARMAGSADSVGDDDNANVKPGHEGRRESHQAKRRPKSHEGRAHATARSRVAHLRQRLKAFWHRLVGGSEQTGNR